MQSQRLTAALLGSVGALALTSASYAQTSSSNPPAAVDEVVVTGSRVITNGNAMPTPVSVLDAAQLAVSRPGPVAEALTQLPTLAGSRASTSNPGSGVSNAAANALNLRNLGYARGLVLVDGTRLVPTTFDQVVDLTTVPSLLLKRVDIVTGGVSAVYGSDAISGVVNFITDAKFNGFKMTAQAGIADAGDDKTSSFGFAVGQPIFNDRGHIEFSYEYRDDPGIAFRSDRPFGQARYASTGPGTAASPYRLISDTRWTNYTFGGLISGATGAGAALTGLTFDQNGVLSPFVQGAASGTAAYQSGGSGAYHDGSLKSALRTNQVFGRLDYDVTDTIHAYAEVGGTETHLKNFAQYNVLTNYSFNGQNPYLAPANQFVGTFRLSKFLSQMPRIDTNTHGQQYFAVASLDGAIGDYKWQLTYNHGYARSRVRNDNNINVQKLAAALDATVNPANGQIVCRASLTNAAYAGCQPFNAFGPTSASPGAMGYVTQATEYEVRNGMDDIQGSIAGSPFSTWAGSVNVAVSGAWRKQTFQVDSDATPSMFANCAGITLNCTATTALFLDTTLANLPKVSNTVKEVAVEAEVPLLKDLAFAQDVSFNGAARYTDYQFGGKVGSWKAGLTWQVSDEFKLRGTRSRDIRAPSLYDLFQPQAVNFNATVNDLLTGRTGVATTIAGGNSKLTPEISKTWTAGFVYQPRWLPRFSISADAFDIAINGAITNVSGIAPPVQQTCYQFPTTSAYCQLQVRPTGSYTDTSPANTATTWYTTTINIASIKTYGADFEANYSADLFDHPLTLRGLLTWTPHLISATPGAVSAENAGGANVAPAGGPTWAVPKVRMTVMAGYTLGPVKLDVQYRWRSRLQNATSGGVYYAQTYLKRQDYVDLNLAYKFDQGRFAGGEAFFNVQNLFDQKPQPFFGAANIANVGVYGGFVPGDDAVGRYFTVGFRYRR